MASRLNDSTLQAASALVGDEEAYPLMRAALRTDPKPLWSLEPSSAFAFHRVRMRRDAIADLVAAAEREPASYLSVLHPHGGWLALDAGRRRMLSLSASLLEDERRLSSVFLRDRTERVHVQHLALRVCDLAALGMERLAGTSYGDYSLRSHLEMRDPAARDRAVSEMKAWWSRGTAPRLVPDGWIIVGVRPVFAKPGRRVRVDISSPVDSGGWLAWNESEELCNDVVMLLYGPLPVGSHEICVTDTVTNASRRLHVQVPPEEAVRVEVDFRLTHVRSDPGGR